MASKNQEANSLKVEISKYKSDFGVLNKMLRLIWLVCRQIFVRPFPTKYFRGYRIFFYRIFGAKLDSTVHIYASARVWAPWNLEMGSFSTLGPHVDCYNQGLIKIGSNTIISQKSYLCASSHNFERSDFPLIIKPICIEDAVWIAADAFIGPGVTIGEGAVVGARAAVFKDVEAWTVVGGNPAKFIKQRVLKE